MHKSEAPETRVILMRHGQTAWNRQEIFRGRADGPLDDVGRQQALALAGALAGEGISRLATSPLTRAVQTAQPLAEAHGLDILVVEGLIDVDFGAWQGLCHSEVRRRFPELYTTWQQQPQAVAFPGGEDLERVRTRASAALAQLVEEYCGETLALVSHRVVNKVLICHILGLDNSHFWQIKQETAAISRLRAVSTGYVLDCLNDTCHLRHLEAATNDF